MGKFTLMVTSAAKSRRDGDYNRWFDEVHLQEVCAIQGVVSGHRLDALPTSPAPPPAPYLAVYVIEADDPLGSGPFTRLDVA